MIKLAHHAMTWEGWCREHGQALDRRQTLREIASSGYRGIEVSPNLVGSDPVALLDELRQADLSIAAVATAVAAVPYPPSAQEFAAAVQTTRGLGGDQLMLCGGFLGNKRRVNLEQDYTRFAEVLCDCCEVAGEHGVSVAFHPHLGCLIETTSQTQRLLESGLDRFNNFALCMDTGHLAAAGVEPLAFINTFGSRIRHVHLKDWFDEPGAGHFVELGSGNVGLDFAAIVVALDAIGYEGWYVVETDRCNGTPAESAEQSRRHLESVAVLSG